MTRALLLLACLALSACAHNPSSDPGPAYWQRVTKEIQHGRGR